MAPPAPGGRGGGGGTPPSKGGGGGEVSMGGVGTGVCRELDSPPIEEPREEGGKFWSDSWLPSLVPFSSVRKENNPRSRDIHVVDPAPTEASSLSAELPPPPSPTRSVRGVVSLEDMVSLEDEPSGSLVKTSPPAGNKNRHDNIRCVVCPALGCKGSSSHPMRFPRH